MEGVDEDFYEGENFVPMTPVGMKMFLENPLVWVGGAIAGAALVLLLAKSMAAPVAVSGTSSEGAQVIENIRAAENALVETNLAIAEGRQRFDLDPTLPTRLGTEQALVLDLAAQIREKIRQQQSDTKSPNRNESIEILYQQAIEEAMKLIVLAENGEGGAIVYEDPKTGKRTDLEVPPTLLVSLALTKLNAIMAAQDSMAIPSVNLENIGNNIAQEEAERKQRREEVLRARGQEKLAERLSQKDLYGNEVREFMGNGGLMN
jgi:hypothetical protein